MPIRLLAMSGLWCLWGLSAGCSPPFEPSGNPPGNPSGAVIPGALLFTPAGAIVGTSVTFEMKGATSVDASGRVDPQLPITFTWDFGDGATASGATASHTYATVGVFRLAVTVIDGKGHTATAISTVLVMDLTGDWYVWWPAGSHPLLGGHPHISITQNG